MSGVQFVRSCYGTFIHNFYFIVVVVVDCLSLFQSFSPSRRLDVSVCVWHFLISHTPAPFIPTQNIMKIHIVKRFEGQSWDSRGNGTGIIFTFSHFVFFAHSVFYCQERLCVHTVAHALPSMPSRQCRLSTQIAEP